MIRDRAMRGCAIFAALMILAGTVQAASERTPPSLEGTINLNEAAVEQLRLLPGIGPGKALRIVEQRKRRRFVRVEDLVLVKGIGPATFRRLARYLRVDGPTTLRRKRS